MLNYVCLSLAPNLRCQDLTKVQSIVIFVPAAVEAFFSLVLAIADSSLRGRKRWVLVCDGLSFFILALLDFLAHLVSGISTSRQVFSVIDFIIAGASFIPLFTYLLFLLLFAKSSLTSSIPSRFRLTLAVSLSASIPLIIAFNELGSLLGLSHQNISIAGKFPILAVGFSNETFQHVSLYFSSATLILFVLFQEGLFTLTFVRVIRAFIDERRFEDARHGPTEQIHLFRGLGWLSAGLKLGAIESVVGFAETCFAVVLTRRLLRLFGRGAVIIGVIKGLNVVEDFVQFEAQVRAMRSESDMTRMNARSPAEAALPPFRLAISNPRTSTFQQLSPNATSFHAAQTEKRAKKPSPLSLSLGPDSTFNRFDNQFGSRLTAPNQRVTVHWNGKAAPVLNVRFSKLRFSLSGLPTALGAPLSAVDQFKRSSKQDAESYENPLNRLSLSRTSSASSASSSEAVLELTSRFPCLPPHAMTPTTFSTRDNRSIPSRMQNRESLHSDWKDQEMSADVRSVMSNPSFVNKQSGLFNPPGHLRRDHNAVSRFSISTFYADEERSYRESVDDAVIMIRSPLTTPGLSNGPTINTTSSIPAVPPDRQGTVGYSQTIGARSFNRHASNRSLSFVEDNTGQRNFVAKARPSTIGLTRDTDKDIWRQVDKIRIQSVSPARKTPPAEMSPVRRSTLVLHSHDIRGAVSLKRHMGLKSGYI